MLESFDAGPTARIQVDGLERQRLERIGVTDPTLQDEVFREMGRVVAELTAHDAVVWVPASDLLGRDQQHSSTD